jgi:hypothetical protein
MPDDKHLTINEEAGLPENWVPLDTPPIVPSKVQNQNPDNSSSSSAPLVGSLPPGYQLDADFVRNAYRGQNVPNLSLMPLGIQGNPTSNAGIQSTAKQIVTQAIAAIPPTSTTDVESIASNVTASAAYNVQLSDRDTLISLTNNSGGTVTLPSTGGGAFAFVQASHVLVGSDVGTVSMTNGQRNLLFLIVNSQRAFANTTFTVTDTNGNNWVQLYIAVDSGATTNAAWYAEGVAAGSNTITVTAVHGAGGFAQNDITVAEYAGIKPSGSLDAFQSGGNTGVNVTTTVNNDLVIFAAPGASGGAHATQAPWTSRYNDGFQIIQDQIVVSSGTNITGVSATSPNLANGDPRSIAAFKPGIPLSAAGFTAGWYTYIQNIGTGTFQLQSNALIDNSGANVSIGAGQGLLVVYDGTNWFTERGINFVLPIGVASGGTGDSTLTAHNVLIGEGTSPIAFAAPGVAGTVLTSNGVSADPTFQALPAFPTPTVGSNILLGSFTVSDSADIRGLTIFSHIRGRDIMNVAQSYNSKFVFGAGQTAGTIQVSSVRVYQMNQANPSGNLFAAYTLSAAANASGGNTVYTGTNLGFLVPGNKLNIAGFANANNNGTPFTVVSSTTTTVTVNNPNGVAETHAGTATLCVLVIGSLTSFNITAVGGAQETTVLLPNIPLNSAFDYVVAVYFNAANTSIPIIAGVADTLTNDGNQLRGATFTGDGTGVAVNGVLPAFTGYPTRTLMHQFTVAS